MTHLADTFQRNWQYPFAGHTAFAIAQYRMTVASVLAWTNGIDRAQCIGATGKGGFGDFCKIGNIRR